MHTFEETEKIYNLVNKQVVCEGQVDRYTLITNRIKTIRAKKDPKKPDLKVNKQPTNESNNNN